jgi:hypothetical protein
VIHYYRTIPGYYADNEISKHNQDYEMGTYPVALGSEMLRWAQHDRVVTHTDAWNNLLRGIIGDGRIQTY